MNDAVIVECRGVSKRYGRQQALADFDLDLHGGEVCGLLGPNGAGKTTLIKIILGLATPSRGAIRLFGLDLFANRRRAIRQVGAVVEAPIFFEYMTAWDNLRYLVALSGRVDPRELREALALVGLADAADKRVGAYSYGMKQRLGIAQALLPESRFLILDEPTNGLDPHGIAGVRQLIRRLVRERGISVLLSSHLLTEVEQVCDRVVIIHEGRKVLEGPVAELREERRRLIVRVRASPGARERLAARQPATLAATETVVEAGFVRTAEETPELVRQLVADGLDVLTVQPRVRTLEDVFLEHTRKGGVDAGPDPLRAEEAGSPEEEPDRPA